ncbi:hypothetical protein IID19_04435 [Patescibacteria group bacterium]|nr:hypothetical protein [Patescibacteria group bacterium]
MLISKLVDIEVTWVKTGIIFVILFFYVLLGAGVSYILSPQTPAQWEAWHELYLSGEGPSANHYRVVVVWISEGVKNALSTTTAEAYLFVRVVFLTLVAQFFYLYMKRWFKDIAAFAGTLFLGASFPFLSIYDIQPADPIYFLLFLFGMIAILEHKPWIVLGIVMLGMFVKEAILFLPIFYAIVHLYKRYWKRELLYSVVIGAGGALSFYLMRYVLFGHSVEFEMFQHIYNFELFINWFRLSPITNPGIFFVYIFNIMWVFAYLGWRNKPQFIQRSLLFVPVLLLVYLFLVRLDETRHMVLIGFIVIPAAFMTLFPETRRTNELLHEKK